MAAYEVRCNGTACGQVEAADTQAAVDAAYALRPWPRSETMSLLLLPARNAIMHILFDATNGRALARHESYRALAALHYIQFANVDGAIVRCGENKAYAQFSPRLLATMATNAGIADVPKEYAALVKTVRAHLEEAAWLLLPYTAQQLDTQAHRVQADDARPMAFDPGSDMPKLLPNWCAEPLVNRKRVDSTFWINFASGDPTGVSDPVALPTTARGGTMPARNSAPTTNIEDTTMAAKPAKKAVAKKSAPAKKTAPAKKAVAKKAAPAAPAAAKPAKAAAVAQVEQNGIKRPRPGGNTATVWEVCDALFAKKGSCPAFKEVDEAVEKKNADIPTATRRSNYAVWRKFNGISGRVS